MNILEALSFAQALRVIFEVDFEPREESFIACSPAQYESLQRQGIDTSKRWFTVTRGAFEQANNPPEEARIVDESERELLLQAATFIHKASDTSGRTFGSFKERMEYVKSVLPEALWRTEP